MGIKLEYFCQDTYTYMNINSFTDKYKLIDVLNEKHGIFLVRDQDTGRQYVEKILTVYSIDIYNLLLAHPVNHVPMIHDLFESEGVLYVIEEYVYGHNLKDLLNLHGALPKQKAVSIVQKTCRVLSDLHSFVPPIIHRDIKPSNIIIAPDDTVWLIDLNASKLENTLETKDTVLIGTEGYAAPEQYGFGSSNTKTDIYALGILFNELLTGTLPSEEKAPEPAWSIIEKCTRLDADERYDSVNTILHVLEKTYPLTDEIHKNDKVYHKWFPPGFRSGRVWKMILATLGYIFLFAVGLNLNVKNVNTLKLWINRAAFIFIGLFILFFLFNYGNIWGIIGLTKIKILWIRVILIVIAAALLFGILMFIFTGIDSVL